MANSLDSLSTGKCVRVFRESLKSIIRDTKAEIIITFGPSGATGHPDHRMISSLVTEYLENQSRSELPSFEKLYHISLPAGKEALFGAAGTVQEEYITTIIDARDGLESAAKVASCYKSQHQPFATQAINNYIRDHLEGKAFLRLVLSRKEKSFEVENEL